VLIEQVDGIGFKTLKRSLSHLLDVLRLAIEPWKSSEIESKFCGNHHLLAERGKGFAYEFFIGEWAVNFGRVEESDATLDSRADQRDTLFLVYSRAIAKAQSHATEPQSRNFEAAFSKFALLHCSRLMNRFSHRD